MMVRHASSLGMASSLSLSLSQ
ncbi:unnamed protein product [Spirodela intermedia]|uniref:Uncharacterized protein n=1 Tax=Spirodela intermedia TaxID=51605 RepID=A0A7I8KWR5_SPIIN|nr:unnamed protein product [Spirodela intermedia]